MRTIAPVWVYTTALALAAIAGSVNALAWLGSDHKGVSHVTGALTEAGTQVALLGEGRVMPSVVVVLSFLAGAILSGAIIGGSSLRLGRRYGLGLMIEGALLVGAYAAARSGSPGAADCLAASACGLQNALASSFSGAVLRTTHMTGVITDLGLLLGRALRARHVDWWQLWLFLALLLGFLGGATAGAGLSTAFGHEAVLFPAAATIGGGTVYWLWLRSRLRRAPVEGPPGA